MQNPENRSACGAELQEKLWAATVAAPETLYQSTWRDYIFAEIWSRPGLDVKARYLIAIAGVASNGNPSDSLDHYIRGALSNQELSVQELREVAVHSSIYNGWSSGAVIDAAVSRMSQALNLTDDGFKPLAEKPWEPSDRLQRGADEFAQVMTFPGPPPVAPYFEGGILNFVFGEVWHRESLSQRSRRWVTLVGVCDSAATSPIQTHIYGAMASGNTTVEEMQEFVLQYAVHAGWPKASYVQGVLFDMAHKIKNNLTWDGQPKS
ncbi:carboxymuconolactone decarboxylase family protein [Aestuariicella hydrocarbonica]|uniref:Carboxymuconolactone decarboxylase family protein n=1 Tax=Pseudomaricurvus hydrocarbonicus TaxID=1470433 RepID=A0A9E5JUD7_9GAMM|nr:carboxymuconolactone decarboxylase family protein [Aestuariicella hydrocarbonica]NHO65656.1 carboxymuconolactone decarboxylase family protein [Aestuariicella hydrocarbonica]